MLACHNIFVFLSVVGWLLQFLNWFNHERPEIKEKIVDK